MNRTVTALALGFGLGCFGISAGMAQTLRPVARPAELVPAAVQQSAPTPDAGAEPAVTAQTPTAQPLRQIPDGPTIGPETNLPIPRFVSLGADEVNVRRGPSLSHRVDWVFVRRDMPLQVVGEYGHWRRVVDIDGMGGWVHYSFLSGARYAIVQDDTLMIYGRATPDSSEVAELERGVIARLGECTETMCRLTTGGYRGWGDRDGLWGLLPDEVRD